MVLGCNQLDPAWESVIPSFSSFEGKFCSFLPLKIEISGVDFVSCDTT